MHRGDAADDVIGRPVLVLTRIKHTTVSWKEGKPDCRRLFGFWRLFLQSAPSSPATICCRDPCPLRISLWWRWWCWT